MIPVTTPLEQDVGFVYVPATLELYGSRADCFPKLVAPPFEPKTLPELSLANVGDLAAGLGIAETAEANVARQVGRMHSISYRDVRMRYVSTVQLQSALDRAKCPALAELFDGKAVPVKQPLAPLLVIARVWMGKPDIVVDVGDYSQLEAKVSGLQRLLKKLDLKFNAEVSGDKAASKRIVLRAMNDVPIAITPAFVPRYFPGYSMGVGVKTAPPTEVTWEVYNPDQSPSQVELMRETLLSPDPSH